MACKLLIKINEEITAKGKKNMSIGKPSQDMRVFWVDAFKICPVMGIPHETYIHYCESIYRMTDRLLMPR